MTASENTTQTKLPTDKRFNTFSLWEVLTKKTNLETGSTECKRPELLKIEIENLGIVALHNMPCAVDNKQPAVYDCGSGIFHPSWVAQEQGWQLVRCKNQFQRWLLATFFKVEFNY